jgi:dynein assembly factor 1
LLGFKKI